MQDETEGNGLGPMGQNSGLWALALCALWVVLLAIFYSFPQIDLSVAAYFFEPSACAAGAVVDVCGHFPLGQSEALRGLRKMLFYLPHIAALAVFLSLAAGLSGKGRGPARREPVRPKVIALAVLAIGPWLIVNAGLKEYWGRPRPNQTDVFGGDLSFVPAGSPFGHCDQNCSFISGEAAGAGWLICLLPLMPPAIRRYLGLPVILACLATPVLRVAFGAHYLSDAVLGWLSSPVVFALVIFFTEELERRRKRTVQRQRQSSTGE
ncbi:phosphatase PAP2 family protein [Allorhizobium undicola]|uniref:phosphatase PAP2 family protein n=1 Tax=Allorhizobium undicola TaxID=78527 RepID=UPI000687ADF2|nr:phosphatase PAP2 family protein [Allorhizobium undicola]